MPTMTRRRIRTRCDHGLCKNKLHPDHYFLVDLRDGKEPIKISACTKEHLEQLRTGWKRYLVP